MRDVYFFIKYTARSFRTPYFKGTVTRDRSGFEEMHGQF